MKRKHIDLLLIMSFIWTTVATGNAQGYPPAAGMPGSTAMIADSLAFVNWAVGCNVLRGYQDISNSAGPFTSAGDNTMATGKALTNGPVSLGDGGYAVCTFQHPLKNGPGPDFAVFENGFDDSFLELAFVEVSSNGSDFFRFPAHSLSDTVNQTGSFGSTDPTKINNLAGKYRGGYGVPFDLAELATFTALNVNAVTHVRIVDVVGNLDVQYATRDSHHNKINDPWPTDFPSGGFDLDAVGVIHENAVTGIGEEHMRRLAVYPNPAKGNGALHISSPCRVNEGALFDLFGNEVYAFTANECSLPGLANGVYCLRVNSPCGTFTCKVILY